MKRNKHRSAYADNARRGGSLTRTMLNVARKVVRSVIILFRKIGEGILLAIRSWVESSSTARGY